MSFVGFGIYYCWARQRTFYFMKNLRFRAFKKSTKEMLTVSIINILNGYVEAYRNDDINDKEVLFFIDIDLIQYAGKLGHLKSPLWEGDIVEVQMNKYGQKIGNPHKAYIKFNHHFSQWQYCYFTVSNYWGTSDIKGEFLTPTGLNIYENPELLNS